MPTDLRSVKPPDTPSSDDLAAVLDEVELTTVYDPDHAHETASAVEEQAERLGDEVTRMRALLVKADVDGLRGRTVSSARTIRSVNRWATEHDHTYLLARSHRLLSTFFGAIGDDVAYLEHALRAVELLDDSMHPRMHADHLMGLAIVQGRTGSPEAGRENLAVAEQIAARQGTPQMVLRIVNNLAYLEYQAGEHDSAVRAAERLLALLDEHRLAITMPQLDTVARAYLEVGRHDDAEKALQDLLQDQARLDAGIAVDPESGAELLLTLAEVQRRRGDHDAAAQSLARCRTICRTCGLGGVLVRARLEQAKLHAATERYRDAYLELTEYVGESQQLNSDARDARARMLQTVFEAEEAKRTSERYQEMAHRDPLTGLYNRRFVDGELPVLLEGRGDGTTTVSTAFVDLDHFKRINDTLSHEVGDEVLRVVGGFLADAAAPTGFAARMGGEEFLLVLPGVGHEAATRTCEELLARIRAHDWTPVTGSLPVRASVGVTTVTGDGETQAGVLAQADRRLDAAKAAGRDRVVAHD